MFRKQPKTRTKRNIDYYKTILDFIEKKEPIPQDIISKAQVLEMTSMARQFINLFDVVYRSFYLLQSVIQVLSALANWVF